MVQGEVGLKGLGEQPEGQSQWAISMSETAGGALVSGGLVDEGSRVVRVPETLY